MDTNSQYYNSMIEEIMKGDVIKVTKYISDKLIIRMVRKRYDKKIPSRSNVEITLTIGRPNFLERKFIKMCEKAGEPFPVKKLQIKLNRKRS